MDGRHSRKTKVKKRGSKWSLGQKTDEEGQREGTGGRRAGCGEKVAVKSREKERMKGMKRRVREGWWKRRAAQDEQYIGHLNPIYSARHAHFTTALLSDDWTRRSVSHTCERWPRTFSALCTSAVFFIVFICQLMAAAVKMQRLSHPQDTTTPSTTSTTPPPPIPIPTPTLILSLTKKAAAE